MKYIALLRGINVGGNNSIKMAEIKVAFEKSGLENVVTYINSGNIIFDSSETNIEKLTEKVEKIFKDRFFSIPTVVVSEKELRDVAKNAPKNWKSDDVRKYVAFVKSPAKPKEIIKYIETKEGVDTIDVGKIVVYMTTTVEGLTKSRFSKMAATPIYKSITIRNFNTVQKLITLMDKN